MLKTFIRPTQIVRNVMASHGKPNYMIYTNKYDTCRTVKCYVRDNPSALVSDITTALNESGVSDFKIKLVKSSNWVNMNAGGDIRSLIVRIPFSEQPL